MAYSSRVRNDVQMTAGRELISDSTAARSEGGSKSQSFASADLAAASGSTGAGSNIGYYTGRKYEVEDFDKGMPSPQPTLTRAAFPPPPNVTRGLTITHVKTPANTTARIRTDGQQRASSQLPSSDLQTASKPAVGKDSPALELQSHSASVPSSSSVLAPGLISVSHLNAFNNPPVAASTSASAAISNKEKTPMCLINELARFNKVTHQYILSDEQGPAHRKVFFVTLQLGDEEYKASGPSIKVAQHTAARQALDLTKYNKPAPKSPRPHVSRADPNCMTPTVELNALAMKRSLPVEYRPIDPHSHFQYPVPLNPPVFGPPYSDPRFMAPQFRPMAPVVGGQWPRSPVTFFTLLRVGGKEFVGEGRTRQMAKHNAAAKALRVLRQTPDEPQPGACAASPPNNNGKEQVVDGEAGELSSATAASSTSSVSNPTAAAAAVPGDAASDGTAAAAASGSAVVLDDSKSEISLVHELALKRDLPITFEVIRETGPPHMRLYAVRCVVGDLRSEGEGASKRQAKQLAARAMLGKMSTLPPLPPPALSASAAARSKAGRYGAGAAAGVKKPKKANIIKVAKGEPDYGQGIHPISRLIQIQQAKKEREPSYSLVSEQGPLRSKEFTIQVEVGNLTCQGKGPNKKLAKRRAAENMLEQMGYGQAQAAPVKPAIRTGVDGTSSEKHVSFAETPIVNGAPVAGVKIERERGGGGVERSVSMQTTANIALELLHSGVSATAEALGEYSGQGQGHVGVTVRPKEQLLYLARVIGAHVDIKVFPQADEHAKYLAMVTMDAANHRISHGLGQTVDEAENTAAHVALEVLANRGLSDIRRQPIGVDGTSQPIGVDGSGDGRHIKSEPVKVASSVSVTSDK